VFNLLFLKEGFPPVVILNADPKEYYTTLNDATNGYYKKLCILVGRAVRRYLDIYLSNLDDTAGDYAPISSIVSEPSISYGQEYQLAC
jgi:hypothetical protein